MPTKRTAHALPPARTEPKPPGRLVALPWRFLTLPPLELHPMKPADLDAPIRAIDILRIALDLPTAAERKARAERETSRVSMHANHAGVLVRLPSGKNLFIKATAFKEQ